MDWTWCAFDECLDGVRGLTQQVGFAADATPSPGVSLVQSVGIVAVVNEKRTIRLLFLLGSELSDDCINQFIVEV